MEMRMESADTIIFLDRSRYICLYNAIKRYIKYRNKDLPYVTCGCKEKFDLDYYKCIWSYPGEFRPITLKYIDLFRKDKKIFILNKKKEISNFLDRIKSKNL
jgi:adenylate kinase family enzyme